MTEILAKFRTLDGVARLVERALLIALAVIGSAWALQLQHLLPRAIFNEQYLGLFLALGLARCSSPAARLPGRPTTACPGTTGSSSPARWPPAAT